MWCLTVIIASLRLLNTSFNKSENLLLGSIAVCLSLLLVRSLITQSLAIIIGADSYSHFLLSLSLSVVGWTAEGFTGVGLFLGRRSHQLSGIHCGRSGKWLEYYCVLISRLRGALGWDYWLLLLVLIKFQVRKVVEPVRDFLAVFFFASLGESVYEYNIMCTIIR